MAGEVVGSGIAMGDPEGLAVLVLRDADQMSVARIEQAIGDFVQRTKDRALTLEGSAGRHLHHHQWGSPRFVWRNRLPPRHYLVARRSSS